MIKGHLWAIGSVPFAMAVACSSGSGGANHGDAGTSTGGAVGINIGGDGGPDASDNANPPACGSFELDANGYYKTGTLRGQAWTSVSKGTTISPIDFNNAPAGGPYCVAGSVVEAPNGYAWALLGIDVNGILRANDSEAAGADSGADGGTFTEEANAIVPVGDGLIVGVSNKANSQLWMCLQEASGRQWCIKQLAQTNFIPWESFQDESGSGNYYARQPILNIVFTVPDPRPETSTSFDFCLNGIVEAASWCTCPNGICACPTGTTACSASCASDISLNPNHCGSCGQACSSTSACSAGQCRDSLVPDLSNLNAVTINGSDLYFTDTVAGTVMKWSLNGGATQLLASGQANPVMTAVDATNVYWGNGGTATNNYEDGAIMKAALAGGAPITLASGQSSLEAIAIDANNVYWASAGASANNYSDGTIMKVPVTGGTPVTLASNQTFPLAIAVDSSNIYWANLGTSTFGSPQEDGSVMKVALSGGTPVIIASGQFAPGAIAVDGTSVYWANADSVLKSTLNGGIPIILASSQGQPWYMTIDGTDVYWTNFYTGSIAKVPLNGGTPVTLASGQNYAIGIALDSTNVYWSSDDGTGAGAILSVPK